MNKKVIIENKINSRLVIDVPSLNLRRIWESKGAKKPIDLEILEQAIYDPGVEYLFKEGILYIEDMDAKIQLGLEDEGATKPTNIVILSDLDKKKYLTVIKLDDFKKKIAKMNREQLLDLTDFAIQNECIDLDKCEVLKKETGIDIVKAIQLNRSAKEA